MLVSVAPRCRVFNLRTLSISMKETLKQQVYKIRLMTECWKVSCWVTNSLLVEDDSRSLMFDENVTIKGERETSSSRIQHSEKRKKRRTKQSAGKKVSYELRAEGETSLLTHNRFRKTRSSLPDDAALETKSIIKRAAPINPDL